MTRPASSEAVGLVEALDDAAEAVGERLMGPSTDEWRSGKRDRNTARAALLAHIAATEQRALDAEASADAAEAREAGLRAVVDARLIAIGITADEMERADCRVCGSFAPRFRKWIAAFDADLRAALKETP